MNSNPPPFQTPTPIDYPEHFRAGMGTENVAPFLRAMIQMVRPNRILEIGAGYTTPFLLEGLVNNQRVYDDGNLDKKYLKGYNYDPKLIIIDDIEAGELTKKPGMNHILSSRYTEFIEGLFQGKARQLAKKYGKFDFVWFDCGGSSEYEAFFSEYWSICSNYVVFHYTYSNGQPNEKLNIILKNLDESGFIIDIIEPHKTKQGNITIVKKS